MVSGSETWVHFRACVDIHVLQWCDLLEPVHGSSLIEYLGPLNSASLVLAIVWQARPWWEKGLKSLVRGRLSLR